MKIGFLAHHQILGNRASTFIDQEDADFLVSHMIAERLSRKIIRAFPPDSPFRHLAPISRPSTAVKLPALDLPGLRFEQPASQPARDMNVVRWHWQASNPLHQALAQQHLEMRIEQAG
jgi:hypothetical protein